MSAPVRVPRKPASEQLTVQATRAQWEFAHRLLTRVAAGAPVQLMAHRKKQAQALARWVAAALAQGKR